MMRSILVGAGTMLLVACGGGSTETSETAQAADVDAAAETTDATETTPSSSPAVEPTTAPERTTTPETTVTATAAVPTTTLVEEDPQDNPLPDGWDGYVSETYADNDRWLCRPGADENCTSDLDATWVSADGSREVVLHEIAEDPLADCFYVYPSISRDEGLNSDWEPDEEIGVVALAGHFSAECRVIVPMYRQVPITAGTDGAELWGKVGSIAYDDIVDAFKHYIANDNDGRPFVLIGYSQGAAILSTLVAEEIDPEPALRDRMLSAILLGWNVAPNEFDNITPCSEVSETGCVVSYATYRDVEPPPADAFFGHTDAGPALCVNPVDPAGGAAFSLPYYRTTHQESFDDPAKNAEISTPWVVFPEMLTVECVDDGQFAYLELSLTTAEGPRIDNVHGGSHPTWGFHFFDMNIARGDLVNLVAAQAADSNNS